MHTGANPAPNSGLSEILGRRSFKSMLLLTVIVLTCADLILGIHDLLALGAIKSQAQGSGIDALAAAAGNAQTNTLLLLILALSAAYLCAWLLKMQNSAAFSQLVSFAKNISKTPQMSSQPIATQNEYKVLYLTLQAMQKTRRIKNFEHKKLALEFSWVKLALEKSNAKILVAGPDHKLRYISPALINLFMAHQQNIQDQLPQFSPDEASGIDISGLIRAGSNNALAIEYLRTPKTSLLTFSATSLQATVTPLSDSQDMPIGTLIEIEDQSQQHHIEGQIKEMVLAARRGDLSRRLSIETENDFFGSLAEQLNALMGVTEQVIQDTIEVMGALANGDLKPAITSAYEGDYAELKNNINGTINKLTAMLHAIHSATEDTQRRSVEIAARNQSLKLRTSEQANSLETTTSNMEKITGIVRDNAQSSEKANSLAEAAREKAEKGGIAVEKTINAMAEINASSHKISDIIHVIDEIAFQTNLLALNAAVEAAHAGDQGRGFAVVANEVRNLAQRSAEAAREIKDLIEDSVSKVQDGSKMVDDSGTTLNEIINAVSQVSEIISELTSSGAEQAAGIEQINQSIQHIDQSIQQSTAEVNETALSSEALSQTTSDLRALVSAFDLPARPLHPETAASAQNSSQSVTLWAN